MSRYAQGHFEYHAGTRDLTWALLVRTDGTLSTHTDAANHGTDTMSTFMGHYRTRMGYFGRPHEYIRCVAAWAFLSTGMGTTIGYCAWSHRVLNAPTSELLVLTEGTARARTGLAGRRHVKQSSELAVRREVCFVGSLLCCVRASGMPLGTASDPAWR